jgi:hypothetical protein
MSQQSMRQAARRSALDAEAVLRKECADRERRLEALAVAVLTALGERDALVLDTEQRAGQALRTMTDDEGLSLRETVDWCGSGVNVREITRLHASGERQAGPGGRFVPWIAVEPIASTACRLGIPKVRGFPQVCAGRAACCRFWLYNSEDGLERAFDGCRHRRNPCRRGASTSTGSGTRLGCRGSRRGWISWTALRFGVDLAADEGTVRSSPLPT